MKSYVKIKESILMLINIGEFELASDLMCSFAALTDSIMPRVDLTYSSTMRELRQNHKDKVNIFQKEFKQAFEDALDSEIEDPEQAALLQALQILDLEL